MKKLIAVGPFLLLVLLLTAQNQDNWYKVFTGKFGTLEASIHLHKAGKNYGGYIWFAQNQWPMMIYSGTPVSKTDSLQIGAGSGPITLAMTGMLGPGSFNGTGRLEKENVAGKQAGFQMKLNNDKLYTPFTYLFAEGDAKLPAAMKNESTCDIYLSTVWPSGNTAFDEILRKSIRQMLGIKTAAVETGKWLLEEQGRKINTWKKENGKLTPKEVGEMGLSLSYAEDNRIMVMFENAKFITISHYKYVFSGGAHGNYSSTLYSFNKQSGKQVRLSDVLSNDGIRQLPNLLDQYARSMYGVNNKQPLLENGFLVNRIDPSNNFYITDVGIGFIYAPYEIKSFAEGEVNLMIPFKALGPYLKQEYK